MCKPKLEFEESSRNRYHLILRLITVCFSFFHFSLSAQVMITDSLGQGVPFVKVTSTDPNFLVYSNEKGLLGKESFEGVDLKDTLFLDHIGFERTVLTLDEFQSFGEAVMYQRPIPLSPVEVDGSKKPPKFIEVGGCARTFQQDDGVNAYYVDGKLSYFFKEKQRKMRFLHSEYRSFKNEPLEESWWSDGQRVGITFKATGFPDLSDDRLPKRFFEKHSLILVEEEESSLIITPSNDTIGSIRKDDGLLYLEYRDPYALNSRSLLGTAVRVESYFLQQVFQATGVAPNEIGNYDQLVYFKERTAFHVSSTKEKFAKEKDVTVESELFVEYVRRREEIPDSGLSKSPVPRGSSYDEAFWENCDCSLFQPDMTYRLENLTEE